MSDELRACLECGAMFPRKLVGRTKFFCSKPCRSKYSARRVRAGGEGTLPYETPSADEWDGRTRYSTPPTARQDYRLFCDLCGRGEWVRMTEAETHRLRPMRCQFCGGRVFLDSDYGARSAVPEYTRNQGAGDDLTKPRPIVQPREWRVA